MKMLKATDGFASGISDTVSKPKQLITIRQHIFKQLAPATDSKG